MENKPKKNRLICDGWILSKCINCKNMIHPSIRQCKAFEQIPSEIWKGEVEHDKPYPGDNGIIQDMMTEEEIKIRREKIRAENGFTF